MNVATQHEYGVEQILLIPNMNAAYNAPPTCLVAINVSGYVPTVENDHAIQMTPNSLSITVLVQIVAAVITVHARTAASASAMEANLVHCALRTV